MRIICDSVKVFLENLEAEPSGSILGRAVFVNVAGRPLDDRRDPARIGVVLQASAAMAMPDGRTVLLECGEDCGIDYNDATQDFPATERAEDLRIGIREACERLGLAVRSGRIEE